MGTVVVGMSRLCCALLLGLSISAVVEADSSWLAEFTVNLSPGKLGTFVVQVHPEWAPLGAARFEELVDAGFFQGARFFRVIDGFMAQFGIHGNPAIAAEWKTKTLTDDPVVQSNKRGFLSLRQAVTTHAPRKCS